MRTLLKYLWREIAVAVTFVSFALLGLFAFFDLVNQLDDIGQNGYQLRHAFAYVSLSLPSRLYELMPIGALIGTVYALSKLAANSEFTIMRVSGMSTRRLAIAVSLIGLVFVALTYLLGEVVAPPSERLAQRARLQSTDATVRQQFRSGAWVREVTRDDAGKLERFRFVNARIVRPNATLGEVRMYEFDSDFRLRRISTAESGSYSVGPDGRGAWQWRNLVETRVPVIASAQSTPSGERVEIERDAQRTWPSELTPEIFGVLLVQPERMAAHALSQYVRHLDENRQQADRYRIAFWNKVFYPLAVLVMMALALPFAYLHVREGSVSLKIFTGVMIGVLFYMLNKLFGHIGLLNTWPPAAVAAIPSLVVLSVALGTLYWLERR